MQSAARQSGPSTAKIIAAFAAIYIIWGSTYLAIRFALQGLPPLLMMGIRHFVAGMTLFAFLRLRGTATPPRRLWLPAVLAGACLFLGGHGILAWAELHIPSGRAALLVATVPLWMVLVGRARGQEKLRPTVVGGILLGLAGVALLIRGGLAGRAQWAELALLGACLLWAIGSIYSRSLRDVPSAALFAAMEMMAGGALLITAAAFGGELHANVWRGLSANSLLPLAYLIIFGSIVGFTAYNWLLTVSTPSRVATYAYVNPVVAVALGWLLASEPLTARDILGTVIIIGSVVMVTRPRRQVAEARADREPQRELSASRSHDLGCEDGAA